MLAASFTIDFNNNNTVLTLVAIGGVVAYLMFVRSNKAFTSNLKSSLSEMLDGLPTIRSETEKKPSKRERVNNSIMELTELFAKAGDKEGVELVAKVQTKVALLILEYQKNADKQGQVASTIQASPTVAHPEK